jgi:hypothetical protein
LDENIMTALFMDENNTHHTFISAISLMTKIITDRHEILLKT